MDLLVKRSGQRHFRWPSGTEIPVLVRTQNDQWRVTDGQKVQAFAEAGTEKKPLCMNGFSLNSGGSGVSSNLTMQTSIPISSYPPVYPLHTFEQIWSSAHRSLVTEFHSSANLFIRNFLRVLADFVVRYTR